VDIRIKDTLRRVLTIIKPKPDINPADWANIFLYVAGGESRFAGRYNTTLMPYQYEMLAVGNDKRYQRITFMLASQTGKSQVITAYILYYTHYKPRPNGIYFPKDTLMKKFADDRLAPSISNSPEIRPLFKNNTLRNSGNTKLHKRSINGGLIALMNGNVADNYRGTSLCNVFGDEFTELEADVENQGDPIQQMLSRTTIYGDMAKLVLASTPTIKDVCMIERSFLDSDQRHYYVPCPHCGFYQTLNMSTPDENSELKYWFIIPDGIAKDAHFICKNPECSVKKIEERHKGQMLAKGKWIAHNPEVSNHAGFTLSTFYSPLFSWERMASEWLDATKKGNSAKKAYINTRLAETWSDYDTLKLNLNVLSSRREPFSCFIPKEVAYLSGFCDVQKDRLEFTLLGHGDNDQVWVIRHYIIIGQPITSYSPCFETLNELIGREFNHESGQKLKILSLFVDSGEGVKTQIVYEYAKEQNKRGVFASKGASKYIKGGFLESHEQTKKGNPLVNVDTNQLKDTIIGSRLAIVERDKPGYIHFPLGKIVYVNDSTGFVPYMNVDGTSYDSSYFEQLLSEYKKNGRWKKKNDNNPNEALDCLVGAYAAFKYAQRKGRGRVNIQAQLTRLNGPQARERTAGEVSESDQASGPENNQVLSETSPAFPIVKQAESPANKAAFQSLNDLISSYDNDSY
jgi:phage terminase large subunit GpA-like protein